MSGPQLKRVRSGTPVNYGQSVLIGLKYGVWLAPTALWMCIRSPLALIIAGLGALLWNIGYWFVMTLAMIVGGFMGRLRYEYVDESSQDES